MKNFITLKIILIVIGINSYYINMKSTSSIQENSHEFINDNEQYIVFTEGERSIVNREFKHTYKNLDIPLEAKNKIEEIFKVFNALHNPDTLEILHSNKLQCIFHDCCVEFIKLLALLLISDNFYKIEFDPKPDFNAIRNKEYSNINHLVKDIVSMMYFFKNNVKKYNTEKQEHENILFFPDNLKEIKNPMKKTIDSLISIELNTTEKNQEEEAKMSMEKKNINNHIIKDMFNFHLTTNEKTKENLNEIGILLSNFFKTKSELNDEQKQEIKNKIKMLLTKTMAEEKKGRPDSYTVTFIQEKDLLLKFQEIRRMRYTFIDSLLRNLNSLITCLK